jgi:uncharacterized UPF0160 family protein
MTVFTTFGYVVSNSFDASLAGVRVQTHDGIFHADDVVGIAILAGAGLGKIQVLRSRDAVAVTGAEVVVDVGGIYDADAGMFDHHQVRGGVESNSFGFVGCAAAGLVWDHYGPAFVETHYEGIGGCPVDATEVVKRVHEKMIADVDNIDTGARRPTKGEFTFSHFVAGFNTPGKPGDPADFAAAVEAAGRAIRNAIASAVAELSDEVAVKAAIDAQPGSVVVLDKYCFGMMSVCQSANTEGRTIRRLVFPDVSGQWRVQIVEGSESLPSEWSGKTPEEFEAMTGISGFVFCHAALFIAGNRTREGAVEMAYRG